MVWAWVTWACPAARACKAPTRLPAGLEAKALTGQVAQAARAPARPCHKDLALRDPEDLCVQRDLAQGPTL